jgi:hypothetical protein
MQLCAVATLVPLLAVNDRGQICGLSMTLVTHQVYLNVFNTLKAIRLGKKKKNTYTGPYKMLIFRTGKYSRPEATTLLPDRLLHNVDSIQLHQLEDAKRNRQLIWTTLWIIDFKHIGSGK